MKKIHTSHTDFFALYRSSQIRKYFLSGGIALFMAFTFVSTINGGIDTRGLMASVASVTEAPRLEADLIMKRDGGNLIFTFGANAKKVDRIEFTLLSDPAKFKSLTSSDTAIKITGQQEIGTYHVRINTQGRDIVSGTQIATLLAGIDAGVPLAITDTEFVSEGQRYSMTNK